MALEGAGRWDGEGGVGRAEELGVTARGGRALARSASSRASLASRPMRAAIPDEGWGQSERCDRLFCASRSRKILGQVTLLSVSCHENLDGHYLAFGTTWYLKRHPGRT